MKRNKKMMVLILVLIAALTTSASSVMAANVTVNGNNMLINSDSVSANLDAAAGIATAMNSGIGFGTITIDMSNASNTLTSSDYIRVDDNRGQNAGWNVTVSATDFTASGINDLSLSSGTGTLSVSIPADAILTITPVAPTALFATDATNVSAQNIAGVPVTSTGVKALSSARGYGQGVYKQQLDYTVTLPNYLPATAVVTPTDPTSQFAAANRTPGAKIGIFAGVYTSTVSYNITTGP